MTQLSTGVRINRAADDPANLSISEQLRSQIRGSQVVTRNAQDASSMLQIADGAMNEVADILQRMRELSIQAANDSFTAGDRSFMDSEFQGLKHELDRIATETQYNGLELLSGSANSFGSVGGPSVLHIGSNNMIGVDTLTVSLTSITSGALSLSLSNVASQPSIDESLVSIDSAIFQISQTRSNVGSLMNRLDAAITNLALQETNTQAADSVIRDTDFAKMTTEMTRYQILTQASTAMLGQANNLPQSILSLFGN
jgi:flagellin